MSRNIIVTGAAGALGSAVVEKFKREGYRVIALLRPDADEVSEEADDSYEVDVTDEKSVTEFVKEYEMQYGDLDAIAMIVGGFAMGNLEKTTQKDMSKMIQLNFFSAFQMVQGFLPLMKKQQKGTFLFVGARPALQLKDATSSIAYALSKKLVISLAEILAEEIKGTDIRSHIFVPSIIDTPANRESMPDSDFGKWVNPAEIAEAMHYAVNTPSLRNMTFKLYGGV
ncbi:NAD(P)-dependent dehydrogenase (short-subunit alcohol dehydrogenase family) [Algoriphagus boseongensis]|uniref:NAD(P)-dependent dehydrogenase (Short-subunit alcohol dehydrogenase family) n=1 Tax=Algoriphagus boseongensis TaxID=1442587 RepID=A0A4R6T8G5_9BACT|nr:SDR family NAD(P)-dependent oxidoreductase [Algoriphagus boseongensis]TDQ17555.1 NAD(P)-dependent dehydrogenase (short-subunit alcohol dehydrogenase family) [Algoriphagus boseongensis]